jgi:predicted aconitase
MNLTQEQQAMLDGVHGPAPRKAMQILSALGTIYAAERMLPVTSVQVAGVSYENLGEAGLEFLSELAENGGKARVLTTLNPAGMDIESWQTLGISEEFAENQGRVLAAFARMGILTTCTCTPYLSGNLPHFGQHIAWSESSAVCFSNSVIGARTNREGGPSALAAALTGFTPAYGLHFDHERQPVVTVRVQADLAVPGDAPRTYLFGALGRAIGEKLAASGLRPVPFIQGIERASLEELKSFCASIATYGGTALFHMEGITPESTSVVIPAETLSITWFDLDEALQALNDGTSAEVDFVSLGCPHLSLAEIARLAVLLEGQQVVKEFWITTSRPNKQVADRMGYTQVIEASGAKFAVDTCCVVAPIKGRFHTLATDSAKACYYAYAKNKFKTVFKSFDQVVEEALGRGTA